MEPAVLVECDGVALGLSACTPLWAVDSSRPDRFDIIGAAICLVDMAVIMYAPRMTV